MCSGLDISFKFYFMRKVSVKITQDGYAELLKLHLLLRANIETSVPSLELKGTIISGMGEGAYYMSLKGYTKQFKSKMNQDYMQDLVQISSH